MEPVLILVVVIAGILLLRGLRGDGGTTTEFGIGFAGDGDGGADGGGGDGGGGGD